MNALFDNPKTRLFDVFSYLEASNRLVQDDTQLEKLCSLLEVSVNNKDTADSFLAHPEVSSFFRHVSTATLQDPYQSLVLALRLGPHLVTRSLSPSSAPFWEVHDEALRAVPKWTEDMFRKARAEEEWEEGSVRNAWVVGLTTLCQVPAGLHWALTKGFLIEAVDSIVDSSIFVSHKAQTLLLSVLPYLLLSNGKSSTDHPVCQLSQDVCEKLFQLTKESLTVKKDSSDYKQMTSALNIVNGVSKFPPSKFLNSLNLAENVLTLLQDDQLVNNRILYRQIITALVNVLSLCEDTHGIQGKVEVLALDLLRREQILPSMFLASQLLTRGSCIQAEVLADLVLLPVSLVLDEPVKNLEETVVKKIGLCLRNKSTINRVLLNSINMISTWDFEKQIQVAPSLEGVLAATIDDTAPNSEDKINTKVLQHTIRRDSKIQLALLDFFTKTLEKQSPNSGPMDALLARKLFQDCLMLLRRPGLSAAMATKTYNCLTITIRKLEESDPDSLSPESDRPAGEPPMSHPAPRADRPAHDLLTDLAELLLQSLCDIKWEVRDTAVVTLGNIIHHAQAAGSVVRWLATHKMAVQIWQSVNDGESYVRAAAVRALTDLPRHTALWEQLTSFCPKDELVVQLLEILREDTEAFARRSTACLLCQWLKDDALPAHTETIREAVNSAIHDMDWEVKLSVLNYWEEVFHRENTNLDPPSYASGLVGIKRNEMGGSDMFKEVLGRLDEDGGLRCLLTGAKDYDQSVQSKSCQILVQVKQACKKHGLCAEVDSTEQTKAKRRKLDDCEKANSMQDSQNNGDVVSQNSVSNTNSQLETHKGPLTVQGFLHLLEELDVDQLLLDSSESTDDYVRNPESLFEDILTSLAKEDEENAIDCY